MRCASCGYQGSPPAPTVARLLAAQPIVHGLDAKRRQLSARQRRLLTRARARSWHVLALLAFGLLALSPCVGLALIAALTPYPSYSLALICGAPPLLLAVVGAGLVALAARRRRALEAACAAVPPAVHGEPARCHICGAELPPPSVDAHGIARCGYCAADNLVEPAVLARMGAKRAKHIEDYEAAVRREGVSVSAETALSTILIGVLVVGAPGVCLVASLFTFKVAPSYEAEVNRDLDYLLVDTPRGACAARVHVRHDDGSAYLILGNSRQPGVRSAGYVDGAGAATPIDADWFVGREVTWLDKSRVERRGRVARVYRNLLEPRENRAVLSPTDGESTHPIQALCPLTHEGTVVHSWPSSPRQRTGRSLPDGTRHDDPRIRPHHP